MLYVLFVTIVPYIVQQHCLYRILNIHQKFIPFYWPLIFCSLVFMANNELHQTFKINQTSKLKTIVNIELVVAIHGVW